MYVDDFNMYMGDFFDLPKDCFPADAKYYFNILVYEVCVRPGDIESLVGMNTSDVWFLDKILDPRPVAYHFYEDADYDWEEEELDFCIYCFPHSVIETRPSGISFYNMYGYPTKDPWSLEDIDYDEEE